MESAARPRDGAIVVAIVESTLPRSMHRDRHLRALPWVLSTWTEGLSRSCQSRGTRSLETRADMSHPYRTAPARSKNAPPATMVRRLRAWGSGTFRRMKVRLERHRLARQYPGASWKTRSSTAWATCSDDRSDEVDMIYGLMCCQFESDRARGVDPN